MVTFSEEMQDVGNELVSEFGQPCVVRKLVNTGTEWAPGQSEVEYDVTGVDLDFHVRRSPNSMGSLRVRKCIISVEAGVTVERKDKVAIGALKANVGDHTKFHVVEDVVTSRPAGVDIIYEVELSADG